MTGCPYRIKFPKCSKNTINISIGEVEKLNAFIEITMVTATNIKNSNFNADFVILETEARSESV